MADINKAIKARLIVMNFLEFAVWGAYLTSMGSYLWRVGLGGKIGLFYAMQGIVSIFMPALAGIVADKFIPSQKTLALCHGAGGVAMLSAGYYALKAGSAVAFGPLFILFSISVAFFMPTVALSNSTAYAVLERNGYDPIKDFPSIRVFGTVGFICSMLFVNFMKGADGIQFQHSCNQFLTSGTLSIILCLYCFTLPSCPCVGRTSGKTFIQSLGFDAFALFKRKEMAVFFVFSIFLGVSLQITNSWANPYITHFKHSPEFAETWGAQNANALISLSQLSETLCILLIPWAMKKFNIKTVMSIAMIAWVFRFGLFGLGNPGNGVWLFILSCIIYGVAFDFFNISGSLFVNSHTGEEMRSSAQGLFMLMTNGIGATLGTLGAQSLMNRLVFNSEVPDWEAAWYLFAAYALAVALIFIIVFKNPDKEVAE